MAEFDIVAGTSTGALIGTYVAAGPPARCQGIEACYRNSRPDWVPPSKGIQRLLPGNSSSFDNASIREDVLRPDGGWRRYSPDRWRGSARLQRSVRRCSCSP